MDKRRMGASGEESECLIQMLNNDITRLNSTDMTIWPDRVSCEVSLPESRVHVLGEDVDQEVRFLVGEDRSVLVGHKGRMATVSPIFRAMFSTPWTELHNDVQIPDVVADAFKVLLRYTEDESPVKLMDSNVWDVLKAADKYQILPIVRQCFRFLLYRHTCCQEGQHLTAVLEIAHHLNYSEDYRQCLSSVLKQGGNVLKHTSSLNQLCYHCLLNIIKADQLRGISEVSVHQAVMKWARHQCWLNNKTAAPTWEEMREAAGELVRYVRYLTIPDGILQRFRKEPHTCLLTAGEVDNLLKDQGSQFPPSIKERRHVKSRKQFKNAGRFEIEATSSPRVKYLYWTLITVMLILATFIMQYLFTRYVVDPVTRLLHFQHRCNNKTNCVK